MYRPSINYAPPCTRTYIYRRIRTYHIRKKSRKQKNITVLAFSTCFFFPERLLSEVCYSYKKRCRRERAWTCIQTVQHKFQKKKKQSSIRPKLTDQLSPTTRASSSTAGGSVRVCPPHPHKPQTQALFSWGKILDFATVAFSFVCDKYYPIID